jgi:hypothetical protein
VDGGESIENRRRVTREMQLHCFENKPAKHANYTISNVVQMRFGAYFEVTRTSALKAVGQTKQLQNYVAS